MNKFVLNILKKCREWTILFFSSQIGENKNTPVERKIIHLNVADFAVAVERVLDPRLCGRPVIIAAEGSARAAVYDMSDEAFAAGVRKGMLFVQARRRCPDAVVLFPRPHCYERAMGDLFRRALPFSPRVEPGERDGHLFLDATGTDRLFGPAVDVAWRLQRQVRSEMGLNPIWSVAPNKLTAKVASRLVKPNGEYVVGAGEEAAFLSPLPLHLLPGIEPPDLRLLSDVNLTRVFQAAALDPAQLATLLGRRSEFVFAAVRGIDDAPVLPAGQPPPAVAVDHEFHTDTNDAPAIEGALYALVEAAGARLRRMGRAARRIALTVDYADGARRTRRRALAPATANDLTLYGAARTVLFSAWTRRVRVRRLRLVCDRLVFPPAQMPLFDRDAHAGKERLVGALDRIRQRFGSDAIRVGRTLAA
jgi:DNA polymerase-4